MEFRSAGEKYNSPSSVDTVSPPKEYYPCMTIDLKKFPELSKDVGEECTLVIKAKVTDKHLSEDRKSQTIEVREIGVGYKEEKPKNEADDILNSLKGKRY